MKEIASAINTLAIWTLSGLIFIGLNIQCSARADTLKVLMIDAGNPIDRSASYVGSNVSAEFMKNETHYHSDAMFQFITHGAECLSYKVDWCNYYHKVGTNIDAYNYCLSKMDEYDIVSMSLAGDSFEVEEAKYILKTKRPIIVVAAGNEGRHKLSFPSVYTYTQSNVYAISAIDLLGNRLDSSNYCKKSIDYLGTASYNARNGRVRSMSGTSVAAALYTNKLIKELCPSKMKKGIHYE